MANHHRAGYIANIHVIEIDNNGCVLLELMVRLITHHGYNNMAIGRGSMSKQVEGKLRGARDEKKKKRRVIATIKKKSNSKYTKV